MAEEPQFLIYYSYTDKGQDVVHALRPLEGTTDYMKDPSELACEKDEFVYGQRGRKIGYASDITCDRCRVAISRA